MPLDVNAFVAELGLSPEQAGLVSRVFNEVPELGNRVHRKAEADRYFQTKQAEAKEILDTANAKVREAEDQLAALATWKTTKEGDLQKAAKAVTDARTEAFRVQQALERAATEVGFDPKSYLEGVVTTPVQDPAKAGGNGTLTEDFDKQYVRRETLGNVLVGNLRAQAELLDVAREHRAIFGTELENAPALVDAMLDESRRGNPNATIRSVWAKAHNVDAKRLELANAAIEQRVADAVQAARIEERSSAALRGNSGAPDGPVSPVLSTIRQQDMSKGPAASVTAATAMFERLRAQRGSQ